MLLLYLHIFTSLMKTLAPAVAAFLFIAVPSYAQFFTLGSEPASVKWSSIDTPTYRIIYPSGMDSLARTYALTLEQVASPVGTTAGFRPNESYRRRMPVILHPHTAYSNGQVTWTPRRMDLMTTPESRNPEPTPWERQLAIHESRHVAQMQFTAAKPFREWKAISGQLVSGALAAIYCGPSFFEGDAVVAETALSDAGRGRTADFLEYFRVSFAEGDYRDYWKWRFGSQRHYTPDYYRIGYVTAAGIRSLYDVPDFTARYFDRIRRKGGMAFDNFGKTLREVSGKDFDEAYGEICRHLAESWSENEASRAPFMEGSQIVGSPYRFTEYKSLAVAEDRLYAIRSGITRPEELVRILENGKTKKVAGFSASATNPQYSRPAGRLYWSEFIPDARWEMRSFSDIFSIDGRGRRKRVTRRKRYYNPAPSGSEKLLAVTHYPTSGGSSVCIIDALTGEMKEGFTAPDGVQAVESVWIGETVYASAISEDGFGIYRLPEFSAILAPAPSKIRQLREHEGRITFVCDRNGADELYSIDPNAENPEKSLLQLSSTRFGASDFQFGKSGDSLYFSALGKDGRLPFVIAADSLRPQPAEFAQLSAHAFAEELGASETLKPDYTAEVETSRPRRYSRLANLFRFHSWLPLYVDEDVVGNLSLSSIATSVSPGATVFFQNDLGDAYGSVAYSLTHDSQNGWRNAGHLNFSYAGWLPVIQARLSVNTRAARDHVLTGNNYAEYTQTTSLSGRPLLSAAIDSYVPLNFSSGGWSRDSSRR